MKKKITCQFSRSIYLHCHRGEDNRANVRLGPCASVLVCTFLQIQRRMAPKSLHHWPKWQLANLVTLWLFVFSIAARATDDILLSTLLLFCSVCFEKECRGNEWEEELIDFRFFFYFSVLFCFVFCFVISKVASIF